MFDFDNIDAQRRINNLFKDRVSAAFDESSFGSRREVSRAAKCNEGFIGGIISGKYLDATGGPGILAMHRLATVLEKPLDYFFSEPDAQTDVAKLNGSQILERKSPDIGDFLRTHWRSDGRLEGFAQYDKYFELYDPPREDATLPKISKIGASSLMALRLGTTSIRTAQREIQDLNEEMLEGVIKFQKTVMRQSLLVENVFLDHSLKTTPVRVRASYTRLGLRVQNASGTYFVLQFCAPIPV